MSREQVRTAILDARTGRFVRWDDGVLMTWRHREDARVWISDSPHYIPADAPADDAAPSVVRAYELRLMAAYEQGMKRSHNVHN